MKDEHKLVAMVEAAKVDDEAADDLLRQYLPFIKAEMAKFMRRLPYAGRDDDLSIAMFAFYEAALAYDKRKGAFLSFAATAIRRRLIDFNRKEQRHMNVDSLDAPVSGSETNECTHLDRIASEQNDGEIRAERSAAKAEIETFATVLARYGLTLREVADNSPKQRRTLDACHEALAVARAHPDILLEVERTGKIPLKRVVGLSGVSRKTLERHRNYLLAVFLAYTNGFDIIRHHLQQVAPRKEGQRA